MSTIKKMLDSVLKVETPSELLAKRTANALSVFQKTVDELSKVNQEAQQEAETKSEQVMSLQMEITQLQDLAFKNNKVIEKINSILQ